MLVLWEASVRLLGDLSQPQAQVLRAASAVALLPSLRSPDWEETFGIAAIEYQALGVPVLTNGGVGDVAEIIAESGAGVLVGDHRHALAHAYLPHHAGFGRVQCDARFGFAAYLAVMAAVVIPIALAGMVALPTGAAPDSYVLALPLEVGVAPLIIAALLGGEAALCLTHRGVAGLHVGTPGERARECR